MPPFFPRLALAFGMTLALAISAPGAFAADMLNVPIAPQVASNPAAILVDNLGKKALSLLADPSVTHEQRKIQFEKMLDENFDVDHIGRFVMGHYWSQATPEQQQEYQHLFEHWIVIVYTDRLESYSGQGFSVTGARPESSGTFVTSQITPTQGPPVTVGWRVLQTPGKSPLIVDVVVEGVSMLVSQRDEFNAVIANNNGDINALIKLLKDRIHQQS